MLAQARLPIRCMGTTHADYFRGDIPVTRPMRREEVEHDYEKNTGLVIVETFRTPDARPPRCRPCWSPTTGRSPGDPMPPKAVEHARVLEYLARLEWRVRTIAPGAEPPDELPRRQALPAQARAQGVLRTEMTDSFQLRNFQLPRLSKLEAANSRLEVGS